MKKFLVCLGGILLLISFVSTASAIPVSGDYDLLDGVWRTMLTYDQTWAHDGDFSADWEQYAYRKSDNLLRLDGSIWDPEDETIYNAYVTEFRNPDTGEFTLTGEFVGYPLTVVMTAQNSDLGVDPDNTNSIYGTLTNVNMNVSPVPEPATMLLLGTGLIGVAALGRKRFFKK